MAFASDEPGTVEKKLLEQLNCAICLEVYKSPRSLNCLHTFCEGCISSHIMQDSREDPSKGEGIQCPLCRGSTPAPCPTKPRSEWARELPVNHAILPLLDTIKSESRPECGNCASLGIKSSAQSFCKDCRQYQCADCASGHASYTFMNQHVIIKLEGSSTELSGDLVTLGSLECCPEHPDKQVEFFCENDNVLCCINCAFSDHRSCRAVAEIKKLGNSLKDGTRPQTLRTQLRQLKTSVDTIGAALRGNITNVETKAVDLPRKMTEARDKVVGLMDQLVAKVTTQCNQAKKTSCTELDDTATRVQSMEAAVTTSASYLESLMKLGTATQIFIAILKLEEQVSQYQRQLQDIHTATRMVDFQLSLSDGLDSVLNSDSFLDAGVTTVSSSLQQQAVPLESMCVKVEKAQVPILECAVETSQIINIKQRNYLQKPLYRGLACLSDEHLIGSDVNNNLLSLMDNEFNVLADVKLPSCPCDLAVVGGGEVLVAMPETNQLQRVKIEGTCLTLSGTIPCPRSPISLSKISDTELAVGYKVGIGVLGMDGKEISYIDRDTTGRRIEFSVDDRIVADVRRDRVWRSDSSNNTVYCLEYTGQLHASYTNNLRYPTGLALDRDLNLNICSKGNHQIHQVTPDGQQKRQIDIGRRFCPYSVCFSPAGDEMFVTPGPRVSDTGVTVKFLPQK